MGHAISHFDSLSLVAFLVIPLQSCAVGLGGALQSAEALKHGAAAGGILAFLFVLGAAFAMGVPIVSAVAFGWAHKFSLIRPPWSSGNYAL